jgi:hypothetical protein
VDICESKKENSLMGHTREYNVVSVRRYEIEY